jgi:two-component sensor histidine kinase
MIRWAVDRWRWIWRWGLSPRSAAALVFAGVCVVIATAVRIGFGLISPDSAVFAPYYSATLVAALVGGPEAGSLAAGLGGLAAYCFFVPPHWSLAPFRLEQSISLVLYGTSSVVIIWTAQGYRRLLQQLREAEATRELLNLELVHRNKNILANVQSIVGLALMGQSALRDAISGRISALGATNDLLVRSEWRSASFREILIAEFTPFGLARFRLNGSDVDCPQTLAVLLALVVHELTTNAVKYGALLIDAGESMLRGLMSAVISHWNGSKVVARNQQRQRAKGSERSFFGQVLVSFRAPSMSVMSGLGSGADYR